MRVAIVGALRPESSNGVHVAVVLTLEALRLAGHEVTIWNFSKRTERIEETLQDGVPVVRLPEPAQKLAKYAAWDPKIQKWISAESRRTDVIQLMSSFQPEFRYMLAPGVKSSIVAMPHGGYHPAVLGGRSRALKAMHYRLIDKRVLRRAAAVVAVSEAEASNLLALEHSARVTVIPNGGDFSSGEGRLSPTKDFVFVGRLSLTDKNVANLVQGFIESKVAASGHRLILVGPDFRGGEAAVRSLATGHAGVELVGAKYGQEKLETMRSARFFVHPSRWEGMPFSVLEALGLGIPVIVSPQTNMQEYVEGAGAGLICGTDAQSIAEAIAHAATVTDAEWKTMSRSAARLVRTQFSKERFASELNRLYSTISG